MKLCLDITYSNYRLLDNVNLFKNLQTFMTIFLSKTKQDSLYFNIFPFLISLGRGTLFELS